MEYTALIVIQIGEDYMNTEQFPIKNKHYPHIVEIYNQDNRKVLRMCCAEHEGGAARWHPSSKPRPAGAVTSIFTEGIATTSNNLILLPPQFTLKNHVD